MIARRERLAMSQNEATRLFGGSRTTWINWEKDAAKPERYNYIRIETVLKWEPGSITAILAGGEPTVLQREHAPPTVPLLPAGVSVDPKVWATWDELDRENFRRAAWQAEERRRRQQAAAGA